LLTRFATSGKCFVDFQPLLWASVPLVVSVRSATS
jgi:hypothetical protein